MDPMEFDPPHPPPTHDNGSSDRRNGGSDRPIRRMPRRRSSIDNSDNSNYGQPNPSQLASLRQRRRSTVDGGSAMDNEHVAAAASLRRGGGGGPLFRPPSSATAGAGSSSDTTMQQGEPLDAMNGSSHSNATHGTNASIHNNNSNNTNSSSLSRRTSMSDLEQADRRASIKQIMRDGRLSQLEKRRSIQYLMDGRRRSTIDCGQTNPYLQAKAAAELKLSRKALQRSSSFDVGEGGGGDTTASATASVADSFAESRRGSLDGDVAMMEMGDSSATAAAANSAASSNSNPFFASSNNGSVSASNAPFANSTAPWASFNGGSSSTSFNASASFNAGSFNNGQSGTFETNNTTTIEVPNHNPTAAAAIAHASSQTHSDHLASKHPYNATTTAVPAVAAQDPHHRSNNNNHHLSQSFTQSSQTKISSSSGTERNVERSRRAIETAPPCTHYERKCHIVSPCCGATFGCRICHDDCPVLPPLLGQGMMMEGGGMDFGGGGDGGGGFGNGGGGGGQGFGRKYQRIQRTSSMPSSFNNTVGPPEHHNVDRFAIKEIICRECFTKQGSKTNFCINCNVQLGEYHCAICNLWMSDEERPYHCPDCGFCRVGGGENFRHCMDCGMCIDKQLFADHNCKVGKYMSNCPVCQEDLFSSRDASHELPCGHAIHWHCFRELASHDSRCPMCKKTAETHERMKPTWDAMAMGISLQPVPPELCKVVTIKCNDCEEMQHNRAWHFLGVQCRNCESFNTVVERITLMGQEAHEFLLREDPRSTTTGSGGGGGGLGQQQQQGGDGRQRAPRRRRASMHTVPSGSNAPPAPPFG